MKKLVIIQFLSLVLFSACGLHAPEGGLLETMALDFDSDNIVNMVDNCRFNYNPDQFDMDFDGTGDPCDVIVNLTKE